MAAEPSLHYEARHYRRVGDTLTAECLLCPRRCRINPGESGFCQVRTNDRGKLHTTSYGYPVTIHVDPIEKLSLVGFLPGSNTFSLGTFGCTLDCNFCDNKTLSRGRYQSRLQPKYISPEQIVAEAVRKNCSSITFTYNEPIVFFEYVLDISRVAHTAGLSTVLFSNGYINPEPATELFEQIDAANIDIKAFTPDAYKTLTDGTMSAVLATVQKFYQTGKHLELTLLIIPGINDSPEDFDAFLSWIENNLDRHIPLHIRAFRPAHRYLSLPKTPAETLILLQERAFERGFCNIHLNNL